MVEPSLISHFFDRFDWDLSSSKKYMYIWKEHHLSSWMQLKENIWTPL